MFGLSFLVPAFLAGMAAAAVPILLHLLKRDTATRQAFATVFLIKRTPVEQASRRQLRELLLLALRVGAIVLLAVAFARPYVAGAVGDGLTVVAVDRSFSLSAPGQFDRARALAVEAVRSAPSGHAVAVVAFDDTAELVSEASADRQTAIAAIGRLSPGAGATRYGSGLARAAQVIGAGEGRIVVVTDLQRSGWAYQGHDGVPRRISVEPVVVESPAANLAVTAVRPEASSTTAEILNTGVESRRVEVRLLVDGTEVDRTSVTVPAGVSGEAVFPVVLPRRGEASVLVEDGEGYAADDARHVLLAPPAPLSVAVVTALGDLAEDALYLEQALTAGRAAELFEVRGWATTGLMTALDGEAPPAVVVLLTSRGLDRRSLAAIERFTEAGGGVFVVAGPSMEPVMLSGFGGVGEPVASDGPVERRLVPADDRHPVFHALGQRLGNLAQVRYTRTRALDVPESGRVLARFSDGTAALAEHRVGAGRLLVFGSDLEDVWNDFPRHPMFVPFVHEVMKYLAGERPHRRERLVGEMAVEAGQGPGFVTLGASGLRVAVNVDRRESDPARMSVGEFGAAVERVRGTSGAAGGDVEHDRERDQGYWRYGLGLMGLALAAESLLGRRMG